MESTFGTKFIIYNLEPCLLISVIFSIFFFYFALPTFFYFLIKIFYHAFTVIEATAFDKRVKLAQLFPKLLVKEEESMPRVLFLINAVSAFKSKVTL